MMQEAGGFLGWDEYTFYCSSYRFFCNAMTGFYERDKLLQSHLKRGFYLVHCSLVDKKHRVKPDVFWPIGEAVEEGESNLMKRFREAKRKAEENNSQGG